MESEMTSLHNVKNGHSNNFKPTSDGRTPWENIDLETVDTTQFNFDGALIRMIVIRGVPWFLAADVCRALRVASSNGSYSSALRKLGQHEKRQINRAQFFSKSQSVNDWPDIDPKSPAFWLISESGLYFLAIRCKGATTEGTVAHRFRVWLMEEVVPAIRATGSYGPKGLPSDALAAQLADPGRYVVIVSPEKAPDVRRTPLDIAFDERTAALNAELLVHKTRAVASLWQYLRIMRQSGTASSDSKLFKQLGLEIEDTRNVAEDWLETFLPPKE
jgi:prophage antirepressor-like protein